MAPGHAGPSPWDAGATHVGLPAICHRISASHSPAPTPGASEIALNGPQFSVPNSGTWRSAMSYANRQPAVLVCGAGGFIGAHLVKRLKAEGWWVRGVDLKFPEYASTQADDFVLGDLRNQDFCRSIVDRRFDEVYQLAADMGGAGYI